jgi:hypothetical protein
MAGRRINGGIIGVVHKQILQKDKLSKSSQKEFGARLSKYCQVARKGGNWPRRFWCCHH